MNIIEQCEQIQTECNDKLQQLLTEHTTLQQRAVKAMTYIHDVLSRIRTLVTTNAFNSRKEEITFFKSYKPAWASQYLYYEKLLAWSFQMPSSQEESQTFLTNELNAIRLRTNEHKEFYHYFLSGATHLDHRYFLRSESHYLSINFDPAFATGYDMVLAALLADALLRDYLLEKLGRSHDDGIKKNNQLSWTASKADLVELIYALHQTGVFNNGNADIRWIASAFEALGNIELGNYYRTYTDIRARKKNTAIFLEKLHQNLIQKVNESDR